VHRSAYGWIPIPIARIANGPGPRVLLMAGNHGDEWEGQIVLGELIRTLERRADPGAAGGPALGQLSGSGGRPADLADRRRQPEPLTFPAIRPAA
jgi:hypothetical protein